MLYFRRLDVEIINPDDIIYIYLNNNIQLIYYLASWLYLAGRPAARLARLALVWRIFYRFRFYKIKISLSCVVLPVLLMVLYGAIILMPAGLLACGLAGWAGLLMGLSVLDVDLAPMKMQYSYLYLNRLFEFFFADKLVFVFDIKPKMGESAFYIHLVYILV